MIIKRFHGIIRFHIKPNDMMRIIKNVFFGILAFLMTAGAYAQEPDDFFVGKWEVSIAGTPEGDAVVEVIIERTDGVLNGRMIVEEDATEFDSIEEVGENAIKINYTAREYSVFFFWKKVDENNIEGTLLDLYDTKGVRIIE